MELTFSCHWCEHTGIFLRQNVEMSIFSSVVMNITFFLYVQISTEWLPFDREQVCASEGLLVRGDGIYSKMTESRCEICGLAAASDRRYKEEQLLLQVLIQTKPRIQADKICCLMVRTQTLSRREFRFPEETQRRTSALWFTHGQMGGASMKYHRHIGWILKFFKVEEGNKKKNPLQTTLIMLLQVWKHGVWELA